VVVVEEPTEDGQKDSRVVEEDGEVVSANPRTSPLKVALAVTFFSTSSLGSIFVNKACLTGYRFGFPNTLMTMQIVAGVLLLFVLRLFRIVHIPALKAKQFPLVVYPTVTWIMNVLIGLYALKMVNIPMFSTLRRLSMVFVMTMEWLDGKVFSNRIVLAVVIIVFGSILSAVGDLTFSTLGYTLVFANNLMTALYLQSVKRALVSLNLNALQLYYYTSLIGIPLITTLALTTDYASAVAAVRERPELQTDGFVIALFLSAVSSFLVNYSTNMTTHYTSPLTTAVSSQTKNFLQTALGMLSWGYEFTVLNVVGLLTALIGSCLYSFVRFKESRNEEAQRKRTEMRRNEAMRTSGEENRPLKQGVPGEDSFAELHRALQMNTQGLFKDSK